MRRGLGRLASGKRYCYNLPVNALDFSDFRRYRASVLTVWGLGSHLSFYFYVEHFNFIKCIYFEVISINIILYHFVFNCVVVERELHERELKLETV